MSEEEFSDTESWPPGHESIQAIGSALRSAMTEAKRASLDQQVSPEDSVSVVGQQWCAQERPLASLSAEEVVLLLEGLEVSMGSITVLPIPCKAPQPIAC